MQPLSYEFGTEVEAREERPGERKALRRGSQASDRCARRYRRPMTYRVNPTIGQEKGWHCDPTDAGPRQAPRAIGWQLKISEGMDTNYEHDAEAPKRIGIGNTRSQAGHATVRVQV